MNKTFFIFLFVLTLSTVTSAHLKPKQIAGKWKYEISLYNAQLEGWFVFTLKNGELNGENIQSDGRVSRLTEIKVNKKNETLCFNAIRENDVPIEYILIVNHKKFRGKGWINEVSFEIAGNKITIQ
ncbi:MAG TPA: hypothetical protein P5210_14925 [Draconibacterium sp.]|nr:hypothetical protein [Draconibacterium sp.]HRX12953.1 hypothetical protein [Draconibacterium sp.]